MGEIKCFLLQATGRCQLQLRRYALSNKSGNCDKSGVGYHDAEAVIGTVPLRLREDGIQKDVAQVDRSDPRWPKACACGYEFTDGDEWQTNEHRLYKHPDTGVERSLRDWEDTPGAMYFADWFGEFWKGPDNHTLVVILPTRSVWIVDGRATNCTRPGDTKHRCWCRHGTPPLVTVDKNGDTCSAGGGSIQVKGFHGFLTNGVLRSC